MKLCAEGQTDTTGIHPAPCTKRARRCPPNVWSLLPSIAVTVTSSEKERSRFHSHRDGMAATPRNAASYTHTHTHALLPLTSWS